MPITTININNDVKYNRKVQAEKTINNVCHLKKHKFNIHISTPIAGIAIQLNKLSYKDILKIKPKHTDNYLINISNNDILMIERLVEAEATGGNIKDKTHVASVVINRLKSKKSFPDTIKGVIFQCTDGYYQFSSIADNRYYRVKVTKDTKKAVKLVLINGDMAKGALFFCNPQDVRNASTQLWFNKLKFLFIDDIGHYFYK